MNPAPCITIEVLEMKRPCPCCACNPGSNDGCRSGLGHLTLAEEAQAHANWAYKGCPNSPRYFGQPEPTFEIKWFDKRHCSRAEAWNRVAQDHDKRNRWEKCHTARTWCWVKVLS